MVWQCPRDKALFRATKIEIVRSADYFELADRKRDVWQARSPIREVAAGDPDRAALIDEGQRIAKVIGGESPAAAKGLFQEVASDALYDKYLKPGARVNWLLFSEERAINTAVPFKLYRLGSREADVDRVVAYACYNHDPKNVDVWPDSYFDLAFPHVSDPFVCYPLVYDEGHWYLNFHALL
jgi:hypothetical protein